ncbi:hypothetical protein H4R18_000175 [Coemansia javaensis]|uniref:MMS19 nucleotide excision repair protein n=1 Tax=Coemansia javaensis TaxID=2761396 RepID=A0A9W8HIT4_9FUNG|nr:hypothetical protein H4R18_000175 [Coemansia javaensis]
MSVQRLVDAYIIGLGDGADNGGVRRALVEHITSGDASLLELVQALGAYLASEEGGRRSRGMRVLAEVLADLPPSAIPAQATAKLAQFFGARLSDATCVPYTLPSIIALLRLPSFTAQCVADVLGALFKDVHVQSFQQSTRCDVYRLLDLAVQDHPDAVKAMGSGFVLGFAQILDGEKDPRALMAAFQAIPRLVALVDIRDNAEDLFDVVFCYFPITFKHRDGDPSAISPESLKAALRAVITCSPYFGGMATKPLVEKTAATSTSAKIDAYETLAAAARVYSPDVLRPEMEALVEQIREDVIMASDDAVASAALATLEAVYAAVSPAAPSGDAAGEGSTPLDYVLKDAVFRLTADGIKNPDQIGRVLRAVACSSAYNCTVVSDAVLPIILERLAATDALAARRELMDVLNHVLSASCDAERKAECLETEKDSLLAVYQVEASVPLDKEHSYLHITRLKGITLLVLLPGFLTENEAAMALQTIARAATERSEDENVNKEGTHLLVQLAQSRPALVEAAVLPLLLRALGGETVSVQRAACLLNALGAIGVAAPKVLLPVLGGLAAAMTSGELSQAHYAAAATTIRKMVEAAAAKGGDPLCPDLVAVAVEPLSDWVYGASGLGEEVTGRVVLELAKAAAAAHSRLDAEAQEQRLKPLFGRYAEAAQSPAPPGRTSLLLPLYAASVCACRPQTRLPVDDLRRYLGGLTDAALATGCAAHREACFEIIAAVINKTADARLRGDLTAAVLQRADGAGPAQVRLRHWVARALVSCSDRAGYDCVRWLLARIGENAPQAALAAEGFGTILGDHGWAVAAATHGVLKALARQRFYVTVVPEITAGFNSAADDSVKVHLLVALTHTIRHMPKSVLMNGIESVVPLLLSAIRLTSAGLKAASIRTVAMVALETPDTLRGELTTSVVPLLLAAVAQGDPAVNSIDVRRAALDALALLPEKYPLTALHTARRDILAALARARDDRKRLVRADAVKAYNKWLAFGDA